nr:E3 ubiquitin-protein ligase BRE1B-like isoform X1 [Paramormyrops kingsleyae]XP_023680745.1 E3 ubiquitin-protein ligase BRE1B-like isoform X1 [Paramormyrops kingsleyae]XP_023680746.1 E3 ubiquitin-protein ligase BRE1B-like isoform X1 [Paramormyrops kingsleyae]XP_023680747.1 E3 ubiquitin-protein ligase BRE1B-like isoform X1 [Paramormyrops kingsleyae]XP_023680749.1 E3 ubiquitin-protein ligase BRE1B-like isoform X1 [Paramormyrops kingsleyae]XP_023680750.1 E3 ubiquitin-protein ligase BRE1B-like i
MSGMGGGKRTAGLGGDSPPGPVEKKGKKEEKTTTTLIEPIRIGGVSSTEEMDMKVLQFKNKKLCERLEQRQAMEDELRERIEKLEKRQATDDATLLIVNRYWSQLDESGQVMLHRYDTEVKAEPAPVPSPEKMESEEVQEKLLEEEEEQRPEESSKEPEVLAACGGDHACPPTPLSDKAKNFLCALGSSSEEEVSLQLQDRMQFSKEAVARMVCAFDRLHQRIESLCARVQAAVCEDDHQRDVLTLSRTLLQENSQLQDLASSLQGRHHRMSLEYNELVDKVTSSETKVSEMETAVEDLQWDIEKLRKREQKLNKHLAEALEQLNSGYSYSGSSRGLPGGQITLNIQKFELLNAELEQNQELANNRMAELEKLQQELQEAVRESEKLKMDLRNIPEEVVKETPEYKCLQSQFSLLYNESLGVKTQLDEARALLLTAKNAHLRQIEHMESDELSLQKKLRTEVIQLEDTLAQVRKEYEMLRIEFEQNLAANEQAGPINREMRHLISSLQNHNHQLKGDLQRYKRKLRETQAEINKVCSLTCGPVPACISVVLFIYCVCLLFRTLLVICNPCLSVQLRCQSGEVGVLVLEDAGNDGGVDVKKEEDDEQEEEEERRRELERQRAREREREAEREREREREQREKLRSEELKRKDCDTLKMLRAELKKAQESQKEMKLLLDMYKSAPKEQRDKVQLMAAERKSKAEVEELRVRVRELEERERKESKKLADEDVLRKIRVAEETIEHLQKKLIATKQEEEALLSEMDVTGQAFEDMQEQNSRLMQQLREKDDANFKLMSERIKSNQIYKLLREEKEELADQVLTLKTQVDAQLLVVQKLEEKEGVLQSSLATLEKELGIRTQALELNKRKAVEAAQLAEDLKVQLDHTQAKMREIQASVSDNRSARERESFNLKKAQEDLSRLRRKLEKQKKVEVYTDADEILQEEINQYKAKLRCPCCNTRDKETVLTKCFHVFCYECLKTRYDTRQRKCPKCNAAFGANDFHRIYIT